MELECECDPLSPLFCDEDESEFLLRLPEPVDERFLQSVSYWLGDDKLDYDGVRPAWEDLASMSGHAESPTSMALDLPPCGWQQAEQPHQQQTHQQQTQQQQTQQQQLPHLDSLSLPSPSELHNLLHNVAGMAMLVSAPLTQGQRGGEGGGGAAAAEQGPLSTAATHDVRQARVAPTSLSSGTLSFPEKLYNELESNQNLDIWNWGTHHRFGDTFRIWDMPRFVEKVMPMFTTSCKWSGMQRQLNLYGFRKTTIDRSGPRVYEFYHEDGLFHRDGLEEASKIKRRMSSSAVR